jgi:eukaryotic-like serine/threonine-protein kinase
VWALGATLYAAVEGHPPYRLQENPVAVLDDIASHQPPAPRRAGFLEPALVRMLDRDPGSRWSMADAAHALHRLADEHSPDRTRAVTLGSSAPADAARGPRRTTSPPVAGPVTGSVESDVAAHEAAPGRQRGRGDDRRSDGSPRRRGALAVLVGIALLVVAAGLGYTLTRGGGSGTANGPTTSHTRSSGSRQTPSSSAPATSSSGPSGPSRSAGPSGSSGPSRSSGPSVSSGPTGPAHASGGLAAKAAFLRDYFDKVPGGTDQAWAELAPAYQRSIGRSSFDGFWRTIRSVSVSNVEPARGNAVEATLTYHAADGGTSTERHRIELVRSGGGFLIAGDVRS